MGSPIRPICAGLDDDHPWGPNSKRDRHFFEKLVEGIALGAGGCWVWLRGRDSDGYGIAYVGGKPRRAHKAAYESMVAPVPAGLQLDHLCRNTSCVNPEHLEPVTPRENVRRSNHITYRTAARPACSHGHAYDVENTRIDKRGHRVCVTCAKRRAREVRARKKEMAS